MSYNPLNFYLRIYWGDRMFSIGDPAHDYLLRKMALEMGRFAIEQKDRRIASGKFKPRTFEQDLRAVQALEKKIDTNESERACLCNHSKGEWCQRCHSQTISTSKFMNDIDYLLDFPGA